MNNVTAHAAQGGQQAESIHQRREARLRERHWSMLLISIVVIFLAFCLEVQDSQRVAVTGWPGLPIPELCGSRAWFGITCPGCGLTRSFIQLAHGRFAESVATHRIGWIFALVVLAQIPYRIVALRHISSGGGTPRWATWTGNALITLLIGNWLVMQLVEMVGTRT